MKRFFATALVPLASLVGLAALTVAPSVAHADDEAPAASVAANIDTIHLRSGGLYRGRATEIVPGDHVTVVLPSGESKRIPWADVDRVIVASTPVPPPPSEAKPAPTAPMNGPRARVHLTSSGRSFLYRRAEGTTDFVTACESPCDVELPIGDTYKIGGSGIATTKEFKLDAQPGGAVELTVDGPSWFGIVGGGTLILGGGITAYVGIIFALGGSAASTSCTYTCSSTESVRNVGLGALAIGTAAIVGGLLIVYPSLKTDVSQEPSRPIKRDAFVRTPQWNTPGLASHAAPATFPIFYEGRF